MTKLKKFMFGVVSIVTAFSMLAFTACGDSDDMVDETPIENTGNTDNSGDSTGNTDGTQSDEAEEDDASIISKAISATKALTYKSATVSADFTLIYSDTLKSTEDSFQSYYRQEIQEGDFTLNATYDLESGDYDQYYTLKVLSGSTDIEDEAVEMSDYSKRLYYTFIRGNSGYYRTITKSADDEDSETDIADAEDLTAEDFYLYQYSVTNPFTMLEDYMQLIQIAPFAIASLAEEYEAVTVTSTTVTVDVDKLVYNLYNKISSAMQYITSDTTISSLLEYSLVENLLDSISVGMDASEVYELVANLMELNGVNVETFKAIAGEPESGVSLYEYICSLADDEDFFSNLMKEVFNIDLSATETDAGAPTTLGGMTIGNLFEAFGDGLTFELFQQYFNMTSVTYEDGIVTLYAQDDGTDMALMSIGVDLVFTLGSDYVLQSIEFDGSFSKYSYYGTRAVEYEAGGTEVNGYKGTATITLSTEEVTLTDLTGVKIGY